MILCWRPFDHKFLSIQFHDYKFVRAFSFCFSDFILKSWIFDTEECPIMSFLAVGMISISLLSLLNQNRILNLFIKIYRVSFFGVILNAPLYLLSAPTFSIFWMVMYGESECRKQLEGVNVESSLCLIRSCRWISLIQLKNETRIT